MLCISTPKGTLLFGHSSLYSHLKCTAKSFNYKFRAMYDFRYDVGFIFQEIKRKQNLALMQLVNQLSKYPVLSLWNWGSIFLSLELKLIKTEVFPSITRFCLIWNPLWWCTEQKIQILCHCESLWKLSCYKFSMYNISVFWLHKTQFSVSTSFRWSWRGRCLLRY